MNFCNLRRVTLYVNPECGKFWQNSKPSFKKFKNLFFWIFLKLLKANFFFCWSTKKNHLAKPCFVLIKSFLFLYCECIDCNIHKRILGLARSIHTFSFIPCLYNIICINTPPPPSTSSSPPNSSHFLTSPYSNILCQLFYFHWFFFHTPLVSNLL